jgi:hypothetical protein
LCRCQRLPFDQTLPLEIFQRPLDRRNAGPACKLPKTPLRRPDRRIRCGIMVRPEPRQHRRARGRARAHPLEARQAP